MTMKSAVLLTLISAKYANGLTRGSSSSTLDFNDKGLRQLQMENGGGGGGGGGENNDGLVEKWDCIEFSKVKQDVLSNPNGDSECLTNSCGGGCCRLFSWLVCDTSNDFSRLACVCNENTRTISPTTNPTLYPTNEPSFSKSPTDSPSFSPTAFPTTPFPTLRPTITFSPTETISGSPTASPTKSPSGRPSSYPTSEPSDTPTGIPTITPYLTEDTTDDSGDPVRSSKCQVAPSRLQFVHKVTYTYNYEVYAPTTVDPISTIENLLSDQIHDEVARNFFQCNFEGDDLWILQSEPHALSPDRCRGAFPPNEQCFVVIATDRIWVFDDPNGRLLQQQNSNAAVAFATDINSFLNNAMLDGVFSGPDDISQIIYFNDGANPIVTKSPTPGPSLPPNESSPTIVDGGEKDSQTLEADSEKEEDGLSTRVIIGLVLAVGAVFVLIILCMLITRGKTRQRQLDYLEKADLDLVQQNTSIEEHLDMGSMPGVVEVSLLDDDLYSSSSPTRRSERAPLHAMDELDQAVGNHRGGKKKGKSSPGKRRYQSSDTVDL